MTLQALVTDTVHEAVGRGHRSDPVAEQTGGPAGNARLTAWTGALLLVLFAIEGVTTLDVHGMLTWHFVVGVLLVPPALVKTASTGWRIVRYYTGSRPYRAAGPPPMLLRLIGPLVVASTLALLGTGVALALLAPSGSRQPFLGLDLVMLHKASFVVWLVVTIPHVLGRLVPAVRLIWRPALAVPGRVIRTVALCLTVAAAVACGVLVVGTVGPWHANPEHHGPPGRHIEH